MPNPPIDAFFEGYLVVQHNPNAWGRGMTPATSVRCCKQPPTLAANEIALKLTLRLPAALFMRPMLEATIDVPDTAVPPLSISPDTIEVLREELERQTGFSLNMKVIHPDEQQ